jgi:hypothetical protein
MEILLLLLSIILTPVLINFSKLRSIKQPIYFSYQSELILISHVLKDPSFLLEIKEITSDYFAFPLNRIIWEDIQTGYKLDKITDRYPIIKEYDENYELLTTNEKFSIKKIAQDIYDMGEDRLFYNGRSAIVDSSDVSKPLKRIVQDFNKITQFFLAVALATSFYASILIAKKYSYDDNWYFIIILLAFLILSIGAFVLSVIDINTMYIDFNPTFIASAFLSYFLLIIYSFSADKLNNLLQGFLYTLFAALFFYIVNFLYFKIRKRNGIGGGDLQLLFLTSGLITMVTGNYLVLYYSIFIGFLLAILVWLLLLPTKYRLTSKTPFPLGPYLSYGWVLLVFLQDANLLVI